MVGHGLWGPSMPPDPAQGLAWSQWEAEVEPAALSPRWSPLCLCRGPRGKPHAGHPATPRQVPQGLPAPLGASTYTLTPDADSALPGELPTAPSWGLCRKTSAAP